MSHCIQAYRASILHFISDPYVADVQSYQYYEDGLLVVDSGKVAELGDYARLLKKWHDTVTIHDYSGYLIMPGFIDTHVHYAQTDIIASHGAQLLDWLERFTFPIEKRFADSQIAEQTAEFFIQQLLANGTTTAMAFATVHPQSVDALFKTADKKHMRLITGKVMMDRNAPDYLLDTAQSSYDESVDLINQWHNKNRLSYAVTPRFAPTSTEAQLRVAEQLVNEYPDVLLQSHVAENKSEVEWVKQLFPSSRSYLDVYDYYGLLGERSVYAHCIYLNDDDRHCMADLGAAVAFCPTSNLFLGSGLFDVEQTQQHSIRLGIGSDVGGGTSFSLIKTISEAYKISQLKNYNLSSLQAFYWLTLGGANALYLDDKIGNFAVGKEADFVVVDLQPTDMMQRRMQSIDNLSDQLFVLMMLGDDRNIFATYVFGEKLYTRNCDQDYQKQ